MKKQPLLYIAIGLIILIAILAQSFLNKSTSVSVSPKPITGISEATNTPSPTLSLPQIGQHINYSLIDEWKPNDHTEGFGADVLLKDDLEEEEVIAFVKSLGEEYDPVVIRLWTSQEAYDLEQRGIRASEYQKDFIAVYVKNLTGTGAYAGFNEFRWMQVVGKYSYSTGEVVKF